MSWRGKAGSVAAARQSDPAEGRASATKQIQEKRLGFAWFYSSESGLFNKLRRFQTKKSVAPQILCKMS
jgi:hypothetical protein